MFKQLAFGSSKPSGFSSEFSFTLLRIFSGLSMALAHGLGKLPPQEKFIVGLGEMGFPAPVFFAWCAGLAEFLGGLFLALGLLTRPSAFFLGVTMFVAGFIRHGADPYRQKELAFFYLVVAIFFFLQGGGKWSLDRMIRK